MEGAAPLGRAGTLPRRALARVALRSARASDVAGIATFVSAYTADGTLLPRSREDIARHLRDFIVAREGKSLVGCGALQSVEPSLCEVRTLVVAPWHRGRGIGGRLLEALLDEARRRGVPRVFCLTRRVGFFAHHGFAVVDRERFPLKIWNDCRVCPRLHSCDETAMERLEEGFLVPPGDADAFSNALHRIIEDDDLRRLKALDPSHEEAKKALKALR